ncbi:MAG: suppressor of fused domain protein [Proteobacteria bacterium]|uniref:Suppressor of fused domain protein n=1 Tax=Candidatus Avisuccinivibrio stercorigallinarum TaxID=2840704 RepID=A0A9D9D8L1_9GAMM|nr:suppressor of fused domain protein [Candidatus Avisuccinivibrio stercorigallinarum]
MLLEEEKAKLKAELAALDDKGRYQEIVDSLEGLADIDLELALILVRAYLNLHNQHDDDLYLARAQDILNTFEDEGGNHALYLYLKAMCLIKENLLQDAKIRLERAQRFVPLTEPELFARIQRQLALIERAAAQRPLSAEESAAFDEHAKLYFGAVHARIQGDQVEIVVFEPNEDHDYYLLVTKGLSSLRQVVPDGADPRENACLELALALPKAWPIERSELNYYYPFRLLFDLVSQVRLSPNFVGFGYCVDFAKPYLPELRISGAMLTALGAYQKIAQSYVLNDGFRVNIFQVLPLYPLEIAYRQDHSAAQLLERLQSAGAILCPYYEDRKDALLSVSSKLTAG